MSNLVAQLRDVDAINLMLRYNPIASGKVRRIYRQYAAGDAGTRQAIRSQLLQSAIADARRTAYGRHFGSDIADWPLLTKDKVRRAPGDFRGPSLRPVGAGTGGTTGQPVKLFRSIGSIAIERFFIEQLVRPFGLSLRSSQVAILRADEVKDPRDTEPPFGVYRSGGRQLVLSNPHLNRDTAAWYVDAITRHGTQILYVYPSMLENLIDLVKAQSLSLRVPVVLSSSETVAPALFDEVSAILGGELIDYYGLGERVAFASVGPGRGYRFNPVYGRTELVDLGESSDDGNALYGIVATGYWNRAMPLVRYETGDIAIVRNEDREHIRDIETGERPFAGILGRSSEFVVGPDGSRISGLNHLPRGVSNLVRMQVVQQSAECVDIRLRTAPAFSPEDMRQLEENVDAMMPPSIRTTIVTDAAFDKAPNGKTPFVVHKS